MNNADFPHLVGNAFEFLFTEHGFVVEAEAYAGHPLAEWNIVLASPKLRVEIGIDKSQVLIDLASPTHRRQTLDLMYLLMYATNSESWKYRWLDGATMDAAYYERQLRYLARIMQEHYQELEDAVGKITTQKGEKKRFDKLVRHYEQASIYRS